MSQAAPSVVPIGTIVPFAGGLDAGWLEQQGWLYCDGAELPKADYADLFFAIGANYGGTRTTFRLPDLRGRFARGVDALANRDPYVDKRPASAPGGLPGDNPGSVEGWHTALPNKALTAGTAGNHKHTVPHLPVDNSAAAIAGSHYSIWNGSSSWSDSAGAHSHTVTGGGDPESRPINKYVYFVIKFKG